jgi:hypothetical protein
VRVRLKFGISHCTHLIDPPIARLNSLMFFLIWALAPILLSTISFFTYVMLGNQLTIATAFTVRLVISSSQLVHSLIVCICSRLLCSV